LYTFGEASELLGGLVDPEPDLGGAAVELAPRRRSLQRPIEGASAGAAAGRRRGRGRRDVAARALNGRAELVGPVAERRLRGARRVHGGRRRRRIWILASVVVLVGGLREEYAGEGNAVGWAAMGNGAGWKD
jgi:hypothetical protein